MTWFFIRRWYGEDCKFLMQNGIDWTFHLDDRLIWKTLDKKRAHAKCATLRNRHIMCEIEIYKVDN